MGSLTACINRAGKNVSPSDAAAMQLIAENFRREGVANDAAQVQAVEAQIQTVLNEANDIASQINGQFGTNVQFAVQAPVLQERITQGEEGRAQLAAAAERGRTGTKIGQTTVVGPIPTELAQVVNGWLQQLGADSRYALEAGIPGEVMLVDLPTFRERTGLQIGVNSHGIASYYFTNADNVRVAFIGLDFDAIRRDAMSGRLYGREQAADTAVLEVLAHEMGHVIERSMFARLPENEQQAIIDAYMRWLARVEPMSGTEAALERLTYVRREMLANAKRQANANPGWEQLSYAKGFREWSADNIARWLLSDAQPQSVVERFYSRVAQEIRKIFSRLTGAPLPNPDVAEVMRNMVARAQGWRAGAELDGIGTMNGKAYQRRMERVLAGNGEVVDASLDPANVQTLDENAELNRQAREAFDAAYERADVTEQTLSRGIIEALKGGDGKLRRAARAVGDSVVGERWREMVMALSTRLQMVQMFAKDTQETVIVNEVELSFAEAIRMFYTSGSRAEQISAEVRHPLQEVFELANTLSPRGRSETMLVMHDARMLKMHPDKPFDDPAHDHIPKTAHQRRRHARLARMYQLMGEADPTTVEVYTKLRDALVAMKVALAKLQIEKLNAEMARVQRKVKNNKPDAKQRGTIAAIEAQIKEIEVMRLQDSKGPWFPLRRYGDFIVSVPLPEQVIRSDNDEAFDNRELAEQAAIRAKDSNPHDSVRVSEVKDDDGKVTGWEVRVARKGVFFFHSIAAAEASKDAMKETMRQMWMDENVSSAEFDKWLEEQPSTVFNAKKVSETYFDEKIVPPSVLRKMEELEVDGLPPSVVEGFQRLRLEADARYTLSASALPSRNVIGASHDMFRAAAEYGYSMSYTYGTIATADESQTAWAAMNKLAGKKNDTRVSAERRTAFNALAVNDRLTMERRALTTANAMENFASRLSTLMSLAFSPAYLMINATQPYLIGAPLLAAQTIQRADGSYTTLGIATAGKYFLDAMRGGKGVGNGLWTTTRNGANDFIQHAKSLAGQKGNTKYTPEHMFDNVLETYARTPQEKALLRTLRDLGSLDFGHLAALQDTLASGNVEQKWNSVSRMGMAFAQHVETMNRTVTAIAAYRAATERLGYPPVIALDGEVASLDPRSETLRFVSDFLNESMIDYSMINRPNIFKRQFMGPILQFKMYLQGVYAMFIRHGLMAVSGTEAERKQGRAAIMHLLATHAVMSGAIGLGPLTFVAKTSAWAAAAAFGEDEDQWKTDDTLLHEFIKNNFGDGVLGTAVERGIPAALFNMDLSSRIGIPTLYDTRFMNLRHSDTPKETVDNVFLYALGPVYGSLSRLLGHGAATIGETINFLQNESDSDDVLREFAKASPVGLRSLIDAIQYTRVGVLETDGDRFLTTEELSSYDAFIRALGLTPATVGGAFAQRTREATTVANIDEERNDVLRAYTKARTMGTSADVARARQRIRDFNRTAPDRFKIRPDQANRAVGSRMDREADIVDRRRQAVRDEVLE